MDKNSIRMFIILMILANILLTTITASIISINEKTNKTINDTTVINAYHNYYKTSEKLFDEVEDSVGEFVFCTDRGSDYLDARKIIKDRYE